MKMTKTVYKQLLQANMPPPETGGIIGGVNGIVTSCYFDHTETNPYYDIYVPSIKNLNKVIKQWSDIGVAFYGIFHTHFPNGYRLSPEDIRYISKIMKKTSDNALYFPIVLPTSNIIAWKAKLTHNKLVLFQESIEIIEKRS